MSSWRYNVYYRWFEALMARRGITGEEWRIIIGLPGIRRRDVARYIVNRLELPTGNQLISINRILLENY